jgi:hypothetical protein
VTISLFGERKFAKMKDDEHTGSGQKLLAFEMSMY